MLTKHQKEIDDLLVENYKLKKEKKRLEEIISKGSKSVLEKILNPQEKLKLTRKLDEDRIIERIKNMEEWFEKLNKK